MGDCARVQDLSHCACTGPYCCYRCFRGKISIDSKRSCTFWTVYARLSLYSYRAAAGPQVGAPVIGRQALAVQSVTSKRVSAWRLGAF